MKIAIEARKEYEDKIKKENLTSVKARLTR